MGTSQADIREWFDRGVKQGAVYMIVVCDTFDHEDYPVYVGPEENVREHYDKYNWKNMQKVMEVYDLRMDRETQINEQRAFHLP